MARTRTLFGRLVLILFAGLALAQAFTLAFVLVERGLVSRGMMVSYLAADVASSVAMLDRLAPAERGAWLPKLQRANYRIVLGPRTTVAVHARQNALTQSVVDALSSALAQPVAAIEVHEPGVEVRLSLRLLDGTPLHVDLASPRMRLSPWLFAVLGLQLAILACVTWLAVRQATRPLAQLAAAAAALEPGRAGSPLPENGLQEIAQASAAFNRMRMRIDEHLEERSQMLGAISHDLQTPITRMRLRVDLLEEGKLRDKLHADLGQMQHLVEQGLAYARSAQAMQEPELPTDLGALLESIVADYQDALQPVHWQGDGGVTVITRPRALRRAIENLVDNAIKFAGAAEVQLATRNGRAYILVQDRGPGIPDHELDKVVLPFYRVEPSRNTSTGGTGLGLAIVQRLVRHCHAELMLEPREGGGLLASILFT